VVAVWTDIYGATYSVGDGNGSKSGCGVSTSPGIVSFQICVKTLACTNVNHPR
jgi:hypothetical protein